MTKDENASSLEIVFVGDVFSILRQPVARHGTVQHHEFASCADVVRVYPVDVTTGVITLIHETRDSETDDPVLRCVAGSIEAGEDPLEAAARELLEEIGLVSRRSYIVHTSIPMLKVKHTVYHVLALDPSPSPITAPPVDPTEIISPIGMPLEAAIHRALRGHFVEDIVAFGILQVGRELGMVSTDSVSRWVPSD